MTTLDYTTTKKVVNDYIKSNKLYTETISNNDNYMIITISRKNDKRKNKATLVEYVNKQNGNKDIIKFCVNGITKTLLQKDYYCYKVVAC